MLDLNETPFDLNQEAGFIPPNFFTHLMDEAIGESQQPATGADTVMADVQPEATNTDTTFVDMTNASSAAQEGDDDDASSQPKEPYVGIDRKSVV